MASYGGYQDGGGYQQSNYGAGGGYNSGGFVASQTTPGGEKKTGGNNTLRPVTILQIHEATQAHPDADFKIDDMEISAITFCGRVMNVSAAATNTTYKIDDGTGSIEVKQWVDASRQEESDIRNDVNVRVHGTVRSFAQKRHIVTTNIKVLQDEKELQYHALECKYVSLYFTRGPVSQGANGAGMDSAMQGGGQDQSEMGSKLAQLDPFSRKVMEIIHSNPETTEGINLRALQSMVGGGGNFQATIESLKEEGHLYSTLDEDHVKSTMLG